MGCPARARRGGVLCSRGKRKHITLPPDPARQRGGRPVAQISRCSRGRSDPLWQHARPLRSTVRMTEALALSDRRVLRELDLGDFPLRLFDSHCTLGGRRHTFDRECSTATGIDTRIRLDGLPLDFGEDPRAFIHRNEVCADSATHVAGYGFRNHLYICHDDGRFERLLLLVPADLPPVKNWSPFAFPDASLGFIHSMDPLVVLR